jgi:hypothetical protein
LETLLMMTQGLIVFRAFGLRNRWPLIGALILATFAEAQLPETVLTDRPRGNTLEFSADVRRGAADGACQKRSNTPDGSSNTTANPWTLSLTTSGYVVPGGQSYVSRDFSADRGKLHLEGRYNNEAFKTGSLWAGYNFKAGKKLELNVTPMVGGVFGNLSGIAPGYLFTLTYKRLQLYSNGELLIETKNSGRSFFYNWDQITYSLLNWLQLGLVSQRTRAYYTGLDVQRGVLVGLTYKKVNFATDVFNFGWTEPTEDLSLGLNF